MICALYEARHASAGGINDGPGPIIGTFLFRCDAEAAAKGKGSWGGGDGDVNVIYAMRAGDDYFKLADVNPVKVTAGEPG